MKLEGGCGAENVPNEAFNDLMEEVEVKPENDEEEREEEDFETDYGSVALAMEVHRDLDPDSCGEYRWQSLGDAVGVEH